MGLYPASRIWPEGFGWSPPHPAFERMIAALYASLGVFLLLAARLDRPMGVLGIIFLFVVLGQLLANDPTLTTVLSVVGWVFWAVFVAEFLLRAYIARFSAAFWKKNWWQVIFLALPALRIFRLVRVMRILRAGRVLSSSVRTSRRTQRTSTGPAARRPTRSTRWRSRAGT